MMLMMMKMSEVLQNTEKSCCASEPLSWPNKNEIEFLVYVMRGLLTVMIFVWAICHDISVECESEKIVDCVPDIMTKSDEK